MRKGKLEFFKNKKGQWLWHFKSSNGKIVACSGESYTRKSAAIKGWNSLYAGIVKHTYTIIGDE